MFEIDLAATCFTITWICPYTDVLRTLTLPYVETGPPNREETWAYNIFDSEYPRCRDNIKRYIYDRFMRAYDRTWYDIVIRRRVRKFRGVLRELERAARDRQCRIKSRRRIVRAIRERSSLIARTKLRALSWNLRRHVVRKKRHKRWTELHAKISQIENGDAVVKKTKKKTKRKGKKKKKKKKVKKEEGAEEIRIGLFGEKSLLHTPRGRLLLIGGGEIPLNEFLRRLVGIYVHYFTDEWIVDGIPCDLSKQQPVLHMGRESNNGIRAKEVLFRVNEEQHVGFRVKTGVRYQLPSFRSVNAGGGIDRIVGASKNADGGKWAIDTHIHTSKCEDPTMQRLGHMTALASDFPHDAFVEGKIVSVNTEANTCTLSSGETLHFSRLLMNVVFAGEGRPMLYIRRGDSVQTLFLADTKAMGVPLGFTLDVYMLSVLRSVVEMRKLLFWRQLLDGAKKDPDAILSVSLTDTLLRSVYVWAAPYLLGTVREVPKLVLPIFDALDRCGRIDGVPMNDESKKICQKATELMRRLCKDAGVDSRLRRHLCERMRERISSRRS